MATDTNTPIDFDSYLEPDEAGQINIPGLRDAVKRVKPVYDENANLKRENAFLKAGISTEDPRLAYFAAGYQGDLNPEAIKAEAIRAGFIEAPNDPAAAATANAQTRVVAASNGAQVQDASVDGSLQRIEDAFQQGGVQAVTALAESLGIALSDD